MSYTYTKKTSKTYHKIKEVDRWDHSGWEQIQQEQGDGYSKCSKTNLKYKKPRKNHNENSSVGDHYDNLKNEKKAFRDSNKWQHVFIFLIDVF